MLSGVPFMQAGTYWTHLGGRGTCGIWLNKFSGFCKCYQIKLHVLAIFEMCLGLAKRLRSMSKPGKLHRPRRLGVAWKVNVSCDCL